MAVDIIMLAFSLGLILLSCAIFVNAVEMFGKALNLHQGIIGSILAAIGTALPETIIPIIAVFFTKGHGSQAIGVGAIAGAPFMLGTLGFFVTGVAVIVNTFMGRRTLAMNVNVKNFSRDQLFFLVYYGIAVSVTFVHDCHPIKWAAAIALVSSYALYLKKTISSEAGGVENVEPLYLTRFFKVKTSLTSITIQLVASLVLIIAGAHFFVDYVGSLASAIGFSPLILSLIITPIATELPEKLNSIIWVGKKKDTLALGNITGAMVFQSCFPVAFGIVFTDWDLRGCTMVSAASVLLMGVITFAWVKITKKLHPFLLLLGGAFYAYFLVRIFLFRC